MTSPYSEETVYQQWNDGDGFRIEVSPDSDGLGMVEVRYYEDGPESRSRMAFTLEQAKFLTKVFPKVIEDIQKAGA